MAQEILQSCGYALSKIKKLYIASRKTDGSTIDFPIEYKTIGGSSDSILKVEALSTILNTIMIGGQELEWSQVSVFSENISFDEEYIQSKQGKVYVKNLSFELPMVNYRINAALKEFLFAANGEFAAAKAVAFIIDENNHKWIIGYDIPLVLQSVELAVSPENFYKLSFQAIGNSRIRNYEIES